MLKVHSPLWIFNFFVFLSLNIFKEEMGEGGSNCLNFKMYVVSVSRGQPQHTAFCSTQIDDFIYDFQPCIE